MEFASNFMIFSELKFLELDVFGRENLEWSWKNMEWSYATRALNSPK